ncbi:SDR family oxidoreductase [Ramlibacter henchirensis]|uniref:SDR family oxidoreductase n=1 Tax=Ramlibacter henchirensis TaxID=204072 RepID=A0A4Z0BXT0_9BURK|nr:SDR family oxidoreductase [Ramlibacter henchirensis]TFZ02815.1 SDR family oxidoreductase [Ramlibacter henchirensis]
MTQKPPTVVVTGGSNGIGEGICRHFLGQGATVVNIDIQRPRQDESAGYRFVQCDLANAGAAREAAAKLAREFQVDCLVNNAGSPTPGDLEQVSEAQIDTGVNLCIRTPVILAQAFTPGMKQRRFGRIVNISSRAILGKKARTVYSSTKAAMVGLTRTWAMELGPHGITVNAIAPGPVLTELFRKSNPPEVAAKLVEHAIVGRAGTPDDIARAVAFLADRENGFITGQVLHVCGGSSLTLNW